MRLHKILVTLAAVSAARSQAMDSIIHDKLFDMHQPVWTKIADVVQTTVTPGSIVLDIGSGPGEPAFTMAKRMPQNAFLVTDLRAKMIEKARERLAGQSNVNFMVMAAEDFYASTGAEDEAFDAVTGCQVLGFVNLKRMGSEVARVLKPGAPAVFTAWEGMDLHTLPRLALDAVYAKNNWGDAPVLPDDPLALRGASVNQPQIEGSLDSVGKLKLKSTEKLTYPFVLDNLVDACEAVALLAPELEAIAKQHTVTVTQLKADLCLSVTNLFSAHAEWKFPDGRLRLGTANVTVYVLEKALRPEL